VTKEGIRFGQVGFEGMWIAEGFCQSIRQKVTIKRTRFGQLGYDGRGIAEEFWQ
jgi:hypothetical protein